jgi:type IV secretory pathway VirB10-like protein
MFDWTFDSSPFSHLIPSMRKVQGQMAHFPHECSLCVKWSANQMNPNSVNSEKQSLSHTYAHKITHFYHAVFLLKTKTHAWTQTHTQTHKNTCTRTHKHKYTHTNTYTHTRPRTKPLPDLKHPQSRTPTRPRHHQSRTPTRPRHHQSRTPTRPDPEASGSWAPVLRARGELSLGGDQESNPDRRLGFFTFL